MRESKNVHCLEQTFLPDLYFRAKNADGVRQFPRTLSDSLVLWIFPKQKR